MAHNFKIYSMTLNAFIIISVEFVPSALFTLKVPFEI